MSFDHSAEVLNPDVPLDRAHHQAPAKSQNANGERHSRGLQRRKRRGPPERRAQRRRAQNPAEKPFPGFVGTHAPGDFVPPEQFAPHKLQDVAHLIHDHQIEQQPRILPFVAWNLQQQQCRCVAQAVRAHHDPKLNFRGTLQKMRRVSRNRDPCRHVNKRQHWNHDGEKAVPLDANQVILQRHDHKEAPEERPVISTPRGHQGHVLA